MLIPTKITAARRGASTCRSASSRARRWALSLLLMPLAIGGQAAAAGGADCGNTLCIEVVTGEGYTELRGVNHGRFAITAGLALMPVNMHLAAGAETARVVPPGESVPLARLAVIDPSQPSDYRYRLSWSRGDYRAEADTGYVYGLPYQPGTGFPVTQGYDGEFSHNGAAHYAIDFQMPEGTPVIAAREGTVVAVREDSQLGGPDRRYENAANYVVIEHADGSFAEYLHLQYQGVSVREGEHVRRGQLLALSGNTGFSSGPHLHFMVAGATAEGGRRSYPVRLQTGEGVLAELQRGQTYQNTVRLPGTGSDLEAIVDQGQDSKPAPVAVGGGD